MPKANKTMESPRRGFQLRRVTDASSLFVDGAIVGVDVPGEIIKDEFFPSEDVSDELQQVPWYIINDFEALDRMVGAMYAMVVQLKMLRERIDNEIKRIEDRINRTINHYHKVVPMPDPDKAWRQTKGPLTRGNYRYQPNRARSWRLVDRDLARQNLLLKKREIEESVGAKELNAYYEEHGSLPPGYEFDVQPPVSFNMKDDALVKDT